ncbi:PSD13 ATPase, partial [Polypterus senegalus]
MASSVCGGITPPLHTDEIFMTTNTRHRQGEDWQEDRFLNCEGPTPWQGDDAIRVAPDPCHIPGAFLCGVSGQFRGCVYNNKRLHAMGSTGMDLAARIDTVFTSPRKGRVAVRPQVGPLWQRGIHAVMYRVRGALCVNEGSLSACQVGSDNTLGGVIQVRCLFASLRYPCRPLCSQHAPRDAVSFTQFDGSAASGQAGTMKDVTGFLKQQQSKSSTPELAAEWHKLEELYNKRLWHQLTLTITEFVVNPCFAKGDGLIKTGLSFCVFAYRINPLSLVEIILHVARQMPDPNTAIAFLEKTREKVCTQFEYKIGIVKLMWSSPAQSGRCLFTNMVYVHLPCEVKSSDEAVILCKTSIGSLKLQINDLPATKKLVEDVEEMLNNLPGVTSVHGRFYDLSSKYYRFIGNHAAYYKDALRYLGCVDIRELPEAEQQERAFTLGLAGLLGEGVYNFGELLMHPVLESLRNTDKQWLIDTLYAFNSGNVEKFMSFKTAWGQQMTFTRPSNHRQLTFQEISSHANIPVNEVELLVMKALSVGLIKGNIDEVDERVHMTWVQPRVLDLQQIKGMKDRLEVWCGDVKNMAVLVEHQAHDVLT